MWHTYTIECYRAIKKEGILPSDLEGVMLSDISQMEKDKYSYVDSKTNQIAKPKTHTQKTKNKL